MLTPVQPTASCLPPTPSPTQTATRSRRLCSVLRTVRWWVPPFFPSLHRCSGFWISPKADSSLLLQPRWGVAPCSGGVIALLEVGLAPTRPSSWLSSRLGWAARRGGSGPGVGSCPTGDPTRCCSRRLGQYHLRARRRVEPQSTRGARVLRVLRPAANTDRPSQPAAKPYPPLASSTCSRTWLDTPCRHCLHQSLTLFSAEGCPQEACGRYPTCIDHLALGHPLRRRD